MTSNFTLARFGETKLFPNMYDVTLQIVTLPLCPADVLRDELRENYWATVGPFKNPST